MDIEILKGALNKQPPAYLTVMAMSGRSLLESHWSNDSTH